MPSGWASIPGWSWWARSAAAGRQEALALGDTPNVAARLQGLAAPDTVVISDATWRLVQGYFVCDDLGPQTLKGVETPIQVYRVLGTSGAQSRLDVVSPRGLTPLVGREAEVAAAARALGAGAGTVWGRWSAERRGGHWQVAPGAGVARAHRGRAAYAAWSGAVRPMRSRAPVSRDRHLHRLLHWRPDEAPAVKLGRLEADAGAV